MAAKRGWFQKMLGRGWVEPEEMQPTTKPPKVSAEPFSVSWEGCSLEYRLMDGELQMSAGSVCKAAGISNPSQAVSRLDDDEKIKGITTNDTPGGSQTVWWLTLPGFFSLVLTSRKDEAKKLRRFVTHDLLPSIQKHGCYPPPDQDSTDQTPIRSWIGKVARKHGHSRGWQKDRQTIADENKAIDSETFAIGGDAMACASRYNRLYVGLFRRTAKQLKRWLGCRDKDSPLNQMGNMPLSLYGASNTTLLQKMKNGAITVDNLPDEAEAIGSAYRKTALDILGPDQDFGITEDRKGNKILDTVQKQIS